ncbi:MAG: ATP-dependent zinc metalloprotease FtsH [Opitutia bacterium]|jgi:cell division protease FtsH
MSQNDNPDNPGRFNPKPLLVWLLLVLATLALVQFSAPQGPEVQQLSTAQVLAFAKEGKVKSVTLQPDRSGGADNWFTVTGELVVKGAEPDAKPARFAASGKLTDKDFEGIRAAVGTDNFKELKADTAMSSFLGLLPSLIFYAAIFYLMWRMLRSSQRGAMQFGKSKAKLSGKERETVTFKDVAGCDEAKEEVREVVDFLRDPKKFTKLGARIPRGILMVGPPGTGKTLLARAIAGEAEVPFFSISGSDFVEMFVGVGASRVRDTFEQARKSAPAIIFIDEIDAVGRQRGAGVGGGHDEREQTLNALLVEMDGFDGNEGVIVIAATNRSDVLDSALLRPGRFDRQVHVDLPDLRGREAVLAVHAKRFQLAPSVDLHRLARITPGMAGADLANLLNEGALHAARRGREKVEMTDIEEARDKIAFGRERKKLMDDEDRRTTAYHEAGHAVVQAVIDDGSLPLHKVTIIPRGRALGMAMYLPKKDILGHTKARLLNYICTAMAGRIGEKVVTGDISNGAASDIKQATRIARQMVCDWGMSDLGPVAWGENSDTVFLGREIARSQSHSDETARRIDAAVSGIIAAEFARAETILAEHAEAHRKVAEALLEHETLEGAHVNEILRTGAIQTPLVGAPVPAPAREPRPEAGAAPEASEGSPAPA